jgi:hypothetical protein
MARTMTGPSRSVTRSEHVRIVAAGVVMLIAAHLLSTLLLSSPSHVGQVTLDNQTGYDVRVDLGGFGSDSLVGLGTVTQHCQQTFHEVLDPGTTWTFVVGAQGQRGGAVTVTRAELEAAGWRVTIPAEIGNTLAAAGAPPTPVRSCNAF